MLMQSGGERPWPAPGSDISTEESVQRPKLARGDAQHQVLGGAVWQAGNPRLHLAGDGGHH